MTVITIEEVEELAHKHARAADNAWAVYASASLKRLHESTTEMLVALAAEQRQLREALSAHKLLVLRQEIQSIPNISKAYTKSKNYPYRPHIGEKCWVSGPNCDDDKGYVFAKMTIFWANDIFVLYGAPGYWPNLNRWEHVACMPITARAALAAREG